MYAGLGAVVAMVMPPVAGAVVDAVVGVGPLVRAGGVVAVVAAGFGSPVSRSSARSRPTGHLLKGPGWERFGFMPHLL